MIPIAYMHMAFATKFGIPRQSGLVPSLTGQIVMEEAYSLPEAFRELETFSHIWLIWGFSDAKRPNDKDWSPTIRPPRLGGNRRIGVFASRSPFRPNGLGLSCVQLDDISVEAHRVVLAVSGIDLMDGTPIYDIKPYLPLTDCRPDATEGYTAQTKTHTLTVDFPAELLALLPQDRQSAACAVLAQDPRPGYASDATRVYGIMFAGFDIRFRVAGTVLTVCAVQPQTM